ncbi:3-hydroxyacyl-CoA dehydrogenase family protein [Clostridium kluyveri]|uniref:3-hydroxybutyryl-CoA dehydrogenase n=1 Tax=Clostridium kluyveri TaxID=1534 RepID=A0A1L5FAM4_CLOKL|nr:3-hydroxyacyl-CoA dehydrogenase family protein [Clostridium kluyveri]APM40071.1 3-hydroxybutyryl-CoA dehydrogenase [Clostridium kluyveri]UZQ49688.1 3-hydroxyacyl-CoA dehydrogenase family protein [Clostridium kluyveri]
MDIKNVAVLGTGTMGNGIVQLCAESGLNVNMFGRTDASLERGFTNIKSSLKNLEEKGKIKANISKETLRRIKGVKTIEEAVEGVDFVIECIAEDLKLKQEVFSKLDEICAPEVILASNTSGLSPTDIAINTKHPERVVIAHFWNPPQFIPLVEVVPGKHTDSKTVDITMDWIEHIGKKGVKMRRECLGFIGNRLQLALLREALYIVEQGFATAEEVDKAIEYGHGRRLPVTGPICSADLGGLDIFNNISSYLFKDLCNDTEPSKLLKSKVDSGNLGSKTGKGFYNWTPEFLQEKQNERIQLLMEFLEKDKNDKSIERNI